MRIDAFFYVTATDEVLQSNCNYIVAIGLKISPKKFLENFQGKCNYLVAKEKVQKSSVFPVLQKLFLKPKIVNLKHFK